MFAFSEGLSHSVTMGDLTFGKTHSVNEELMKIFLLCHIVEQTGHGVPEAIRKCGEKAYDFWMYPITMTIPFDRSGFKDKRENATVKLSETEKAILRLISEDNAITIEGLSEKIGKHRTTILRALGQSREKGLVKKVGSDKAGHWEIKK